MISQIIQYQCGSLSICFAPDSSGLIVAFGSKVLGNDLLADREHFDFDSDFDLELIWIARGAHQTLRPTCHRLLAVLYGRRPSSEAQRAMLKSSSFFLSTVALRFTRTAYRRHRIRLQLTAGFLNTEAGEGFSPLRTRSAQRKIDMSFQPPMHTDQN
jgi:hypothetical protein